ncbi:Penicillin-binding protein 1C [Pseudomonas sp. IT-P218]
MPILSLTLVDWFSRVGASLLAMDVNDNACFLNKPSLSGSSRAGSLLQFSLLVQRYFSIEQYRSGNRLQLDRRMSALLGAQEDYKKRGVHIAYQQTLWRCVAKAGLGR